MNAKEKMKLHEIEAKLLAVKSTYEQILQIYHQVHRKKLMLEMDIKMLDQNKMDLLQGQLIFDDKELGPGF